MTRKQYHALAPTLDRHAVRRQALIDAIPLNVNRAGRYYRKLIKEIYEQTNQTRRMG
jgi:hypothetical protein